MKIAKTLMEHTQYVDPLPLEGDGCSRLVALTLRSVGTSFVLLAGAVKFNGQFCFPHFWVIAEGYTIDYRLRGWFGDAAPHGVFLAEEIPYLLYDGQPQVFNLETALLLYQAVTGKPYSFTTRAQGG